MVPARRVAPPRSGPCRPCTVSPNLVLAFPRTFDAIPPSPVAGKEIKKNHDGVDKMAGVVSPRSATERHAASWYEAKQPLATEGGEGDTTSRELPRTPVAVAAGSLLGDNLSMQARPPFSSPRTIPFNLLCPFLRPINGGKKKICVGRGAERAGADGNASGRRWVTWRCNLYGQQPPNCDWTVVCLPDVSAGALDKVGPWAPASKTIPMVWQDKRGHCRVLHAVHLRRAKRIRLHTIITLPGKDIDVIVRF